MDVPGDRPNLTAEVIRRLRMGDFNERFYPELIKAWNEQMERLTVQAGERAKGSPPTG